MQNGSKNAGLVDFRLFRNRLAYPAQKPVVDGWQLDTGWLSTQALDPTLRVRRAAVRAV